MALSPDEIAALFAAAEEKSKREAQERERKAVEREAAVEVARERLDALWETADGDLAPALTRQGHVLNALLRQTVHEYAGPKLSPATLDLILRAQRECRQTAQALARLREQNRRLGRGGSGLERKEFSGNRTDSSASSHTGDAHGGAALD